MIDFIKNSYNKLLKNLKTDTNTFVGFILTLICVFLVADRVLEVLLMIFVGIGAFYWSPVFYILTFILIFFTFLIVLESKFVIYKDFKVSVFTFYGVLAALLTTAMITEKLNGILWAFFFSAPHYGRLFKEDMALIKPAFTSLAVAIPFLASTYIWAWFHEYIPTREDIVKSIGDAEGLKLGGSKNTPKEYTFYVPFGKTKDKYKNYGLDGKGRFKHTIVIGKYSTGKTKNIIEPMIAKDIEKKRFFIESSKALAYSLLSSGVATLKSPYTNEYINNNFSLSMIVPKEGKENIFRNYLTNLTFDNGEYKDLGVTAILSTRYSIDNLSKISENFGFKAKILDPKDKNTYGINPFSIKNKYTAVDAISKLIQLVSQYQYNDLEIPDITSAYTIDAARTVENVAELLIETYPKKSEGYIPNIEDLINLLTNFDFIEILLEKYIEKNTKNNVLKDDSKLLVNYIKHAFFGEKDDITKTKTILSTPISLLNAIIKTPELKKIFCARTRNINFNETLKEGTINLICIRQGELPVSTFNTSNIISLFIKNLYDIAVANRKDSGTNIPNFFYFDDFSIHLNQKNVQAFKTYSKNNVASVITINSLKELEDANITSLVLEEIENKIIMSGASMDDYKFWQNHFGMKDDWVNIKRPLLDNTLEQIYEENDKDGTFDKVPKVKAGKLIAMGPKFCGFRFITDKGKPDAGIGSIPSMDDKYFVPYKPKNYDFINLTSSDVKNLKTINDGPIKYTK